jgi:hypothetical protein
MPFAGEIVAITATSSNAIATQDWYFSPAVNAAQPTSIAPVYVSTSSGFGAASSNIQTITTAAAHGFTVGQSVTIASPATTSAGNLGTFTILTVPSSTTFTIKNSAAVSENGIANSATAVGSYILPYGIPRPKIAIGGTTTGSTVYKYGQNNFPFNTAYSASLTSPGFNVISPTVPTPAVVTFSAGDTIGFRADTSQASGTFTANLLVALK